MAERGNTDDQDTRVRVLFHVTDFGNGGIESSLIQWLRILDRKRFRAVLSVTYASPMLAQRFRALIPSDIPIEILVRPQWLRYFQDRRHASKLGKAGRVARDLHGALAVRPHIGRRVAELARDVDVIVDYDLSLRRLAGRFGVAWIGVNHFSFVARLGGQGRRVRRLLDQYSRYDSIAALNPQMGDEAGRMFGDRLQQVTVLPNAIDIEAIRANAQAARPVLPGGVPYIVSVARLDELQKDHRTLLRAYAQLVERRGVAEHLVLAGDGAHRDVLTRLADELGIGARVHFMGQMDNPHPLMADASILVLSSKNEGMPMVLIEALALGKAIVSTDCPTGPREILDHGRAGLLVSVGDVDALADAMAQLLTDDVLRAELAARAFDRASRFGIAESNRRLDACIDAIRVKRASRLRAQPGAALQRAD
ncbi:glycosyl transferase [Burkholderia lata]|uniref:Glycosyl transferase n=1 Tax=Burkholderia lata (strain ATCC 17760 / DSM 23089 / LMG 22485 / NCIMB 9086 / R18194 / 383) TaxID=482957 RepID=A0A6P2XRX1_BURL3|nr:glycosyltransferase [Burkholderia lata]VWD11218.1 glycosyl transferase [Burkholderia lata]